MDPLQKERFQHQRVQTTTYHCKVDATPLLIPREAPAQRTLHYHRPRQYHSFFCRSTLLCDILCGAVSSLLS